MTTKDLRRMAETCRRLHHPWIGVMVTPDGVADLSAAAVILDRLADETMTERIAVAGIYHDHDTRGRATFHAFHGCAVCALHREAAEIYRAALLAPAKA